MIKPYLTVIIPCYNEQKNLERGVLLEVEDYLRKQKFLSEVLISDDESNDKSLEIVAKFCQKYPRFRLLKNPHGGKAFAIRAGVQEAKGEIVLFTDMDQSTPINQLEKLLPCFKKDFSVVIGSRGEGREGFSLIRKLGSGAFRFIRQRLLLNNLVDTQCGFKAFKGKVAKDLFSRLLIFEKAKKTKGWRVGAFDVELLFLAQKRGYRIAEVSIAWKDRDITQGKQRKYFKESKEMLKEILRVKLNDLRGNYS